MLREPSPMIHRHKKRQQYSTLLHPDGRLPGHNVIKQAAECCVEDFEVCDPQPSRSARLMDCYPVLPEYAPNISWPVCRKAMDLDRRCINVISLSRGSRASRHQAGTVVESCRAVDASFKRDEPKPPVSSHRTSPAISSKPTWRCFSDGYLASSAASTAHPEVQRRTQEEWARDVGPVACSIGLDASRSRTSAGVFAGLPVDAFARAGSTLAPEKMMCPRGYTIPAGASVVLNVWAVNMNPENWPDPPEI